jgi:hypothetical protein
METMISRRSVPRAYKGTPERSGSLLSLERRPHFKTRKGLEKKIWYPKPRITVLARASSNLTDRPFRKPVYY